VRCLTGTMPDWGEDEEERDKIGREIERKRDR
jgi:hypothetical protein